MAESDTSIIDRALATLSKPVLVTSEDFIPDMSDDARRPVVDPFDKYEADYWTKLAAERKQAWETTLNF